jgi:hypothetical protein
MNVTVEYKAPTRRSLLVSTSIAAVVAALALVVVILPAEYGIDPTGLGGVLGLSGMSASGEAPAVPAPEQAGFVQSHEQPFRSDNVDIVLAPFEEMEFKALLSQGQTMLYSWHVDDGSKLYYEFHGEPTVEGFPEDYYMSYELVDGADSEHGSLAAPFTGRHGWYWLNDNDHPVTIRLRASGYYASLDELWRSSDPAPAQAGTD